MIPGLEVRLAQLAASGQTIPYGVLARDLGLTGPGVIAQLTQALETLMERDAGLGLPLRAAICCGRLNGGLPGAGFFEKAAELGCYHDQDRAEFISTQRARLFAHP